MNDFHVLTSALKNIRALACFNLRRGGAKMELEQLWEMLVMEKGLEVKCRLK